MTTLYGIPNCDTVKKARVWLNTHHIDYTFHDFKKQGIDAATLQHWIASIGLDTLINRKGTTWRALGDDDKARAANPDSAISLLQSSPSLIKRPVLAMTDGTLRVGFKDNDYQEAFAS